MTTVLILGAGIMQVPSLRIARRLGWRTVVADADPAAIGVPLADRYERVDLKDRQGMLRLARLLATGGGLDGVFTAGTDFSTTVSWVARALGLTAVPFEAAERATDKLLMRRTLAAAGVPCPRFAGWDGAGDPRRAADGLAFPVVVKPVDSMGARAVRLVDDPDGLPEACRQAAASSRSGRVIVEEFLEGPELSLDAVVWRGSVTVCGVADRIIRFPPSFVEMGHTMWTELPADEVRRIKDAFRAGIRALGIDNGAAKGDLKLTSRGPAVGEIAARLSGGYMSGWTYPLASGVEVTEAALRIAVGLPPGDLEPRLRWTAAERAFISLPGVVGEVQGEELARAVAGVHEVFLRVRPGCRVQFPRNNMEKCGNVIAALPDRSAAVSAAERAAAAMLVRLAPLETSTTAYLFARDMPHPAFVLARPRNVRSLAALPPSRGEPSALDPRQPLSYLGLPAVEEEAGRDWHGLRIAEALARAKELCALRPAEGRGFALGSVFWNALLRGSTQGLVYLADSVRAAARAGRLASFLTEAGR